MTVAFQEATDYAKDPARPCVDPALRSVYIALET